MEEEDPVFTPVSLHYAGSTPVPTTPTKSYIVCYSINNDQQGDEPPPIYIFGADFIFLVEDSEGVFIESTLPISVYHRDIENRIFVPFHFTIRLTTQFFKEKEIVSSLDYVYYDERTNGVYTIALYKDRKKEKQRAMSATALAYREALMDPSIAAMVLHSGGSTRLLTRAKSYIKNFVVE